MSASAKPVSIALVGIGGYGNTYVQMLLDEPAERGGSFEVIAAVDPHPESCRHLDDLKARGVPLFASLEAFYESHRVDLAVLSTPIALHAPPAASHRCHA